MKKLVDYYAKGRRLELFTHSQLNFPEALTVEAVSAQVRHYHLGHAYCKAITSLINDNKLDGCTKKIVYCESCYKSKFHLMPHSTSTRV